VIQVCAIQAGAAVGHGVTWRVPAPRRIATVSVHYADSFTAELE